MAIDKRPSEAMQWAREGTHRAAQEGGDTNEGPNWSMSSCFGERNGTKARKASQGVARAVLPRRLTSYKIPNSDDKDQDQGHKNVNGRIRRASVPVPSHTVTGLGESQNAITRPRNDKESSSDGSYTNGQIPAKGRTFPLNKPRAEESLQRRKTFHGVVKETHRGLKSWAKELWKKIKFGSAPPRQPIQDQSEGHHQQELPFSPSQTLKEERQPVVTIMPRHSSGGGSRRSQSSRAQEVGPPRGVLERWRARPPDTKEFIRAWERALPTIEAAVKEALRMQGAEGGFTIATTRGRKTDDPVRFVFITSHEALSDELKETIREATYPAFPAKFAIESYLGFIFKQGDVERSSGRGLVIARRRGHRAAGGASGSFLPANFAAYSDPGMGDSVGASDQEMGGTITMRVRIEDKSYVAVNCHVLDDDSDDQASDVEPRRPPQDLELVHPSNWDLGMAAAPNNSSGSTSFQPTTIGTLKYWSDPMYCTTTVSTYQLPSPITDEGANMSSMSSSASTSAPSGPQQRLVVTDWALFETNLPPTPSRVRNVPCNGSGWRDNDWMPAVEEVAAPDENLGGKLVFSTGRSSGTCWGEVHDYPTLYSQPGLPRTLEWSVEPGVYWDNGEDWDEGGMGILGDSGAPILEWAIQNGNEQDIKVRLLGQLWGRNHYKEVDGAATRPDQVFTYFTSVSDIFADIQNRCPHLGAPEFEMVPCAFQLPTVPEEEDADGGRLRPGTPHRHHNRHTEVHDFAMTPAGVAWTDEQWVMHGVQETPPSSSRPSRSSARVSFEFSHPHSSSRSSPRSSVCGNEGAVREKAGKPLVASGATDVVFCEDESCGHPRGMNIQVQCILHRH